jgi:hypothetical protein
MINLSSAQPSHLDALNNSALQVRRAAQDDDPGVFTDIYHEQTNIAIWQRQLSATLQKSVAAFLLTHPKFRTTMTVTPDNVVASLSELLGDKNHCELIENIAELVDMFCCLFDLKRAGLRLAALDSAMCPKFHVDNVPCRLVTTFQGVATQWLPHSAVDRDKLGAGSKGKPDNQSGIYTHPSDIQQLDCGDVGLLKGELWYRNENAGLVHRSPELTTEQRRLLLTLDFSQ